MSDSLQTHELHARLPCPSLSPGVFSNSSLLSQQCHPTISSSDVPFSSCPQSFPASVSFPMNWFFGSGGQSVGTSASAPFLSINIQGLNIQGWSPLGLPGLVSLQSKGLSSIFPTVRRHQFFSAKPYLYGPALSFICNYWKTIDLTI